MKILDDFKSFALKGNMLDMAVGIIIGAAFGTIVKSLVDDIIMPPVGMLLGGVDFSDLFITLKDGVTAAGPYHNLAAAKAAGAVTVNFGMFINNLISFLIVAWATFMIVRSFNTLRTKLETKKEESVTATEKECPYCFTKIDMRATRCPNCTAVLAASQDSTAGAVN